MSVEVDATAGVRVVDRDPTWIHITDGAHSPSLTSVTVGEGIERVRRLQVLTQAPVTDRMDAAPTYVTAIERGRENLTLGSLARIARALRTGLQVSFAVLAAEYRTLGEDLEELRAQQRDESADRSRPRDVSA